MANREAKNASIRSTSTSEEEEYRTGKWTRDEEAYAQALIEQFQSGAISLPDGTSLRQFLARMLNCRPKRISKKYEGNNYANGRKFYVKSNDRLPAEEAQRRRKRLRELERRFKSSSISSSASNNKTKKLQQQEKKNQEKEHLLSSSLFDEYLLSSNDASPSHLSGGREAASGAPPASGLGQYGNLSGTQDRAAGTFTNLSTPIAQPLAQPYRQQDQTYLQLLARLNNEDPSRTGRTSNNHLMSIVGGRGMTTSNNGTATSSDAQTLNHLQMLLLQQQSLRSSSGNHGLDTLSQRQARGLNDPLPLLQRATGLPSISHDQSHLQQLQMLMQVKNNQGQASSSLRQNPHLGVSATQNNNTSLVLEQLRAQVQQQQQQQQQRNQAADGEAPLLRLLEARRMLQLGATVPAASQNLQNLQQGPARQVQESSALLLDTFWAQQRQSLGNPNPGISTTLPASTLDFSRIDAMGPSSSSLSNEALMNALGAQQLGAFGRTRPPQETITTTTVSGGLSTRTTTRSSNNNNDDDLIRQDEKQPGSTDDQDRKLPAKKRRLL